MSSAIATQQQTGELQAAHGQPLPLWYTLLLGGVLVGATLYGLLFDDAYRVSPGVRETLPQTLRGQDLLTLLTVPVLVWVAVHAHRGSLRAHIVWLSILLYVVYSYLMYVVAPFNDAFLLYVAAIGLASYGLLDGTLRIEARVASAAFKRIPRRPLAIFLGAVGVLFAGLWLGQILPAIPGGVPDDLFVYDIPSTVHVLDLAYIMPLLIATAVLLVRRHVIAPVLAMLLLVKMLTLGLALLSMSVFVYLGADRVQWDDVIIWAAVTVISGAWLTAVVGQMRPVGKVWLRPSLW